MRNVFAQALRKAAVLLAIVVHWALDDICLFLPDVAVDGISKLVFRLTGNEFRFSDWQRFWNKKPGA